MVNVWVELMMVLVTFCGSPKNSFISQDKCRHDRMVCIRNAAPGGGDAMDIMDKCLANPDAYPVLLKPIAPKPAPSPSPVIKAKKK